MRRLLIALLLASPCLAQTPIDQYVNLNNATPSAPGTALSTTIMANGTVSAVAPNFSGNITGSTVAAHQPACNLGTTITDNGTTFTPAAPSQAMAIPNSTALGNPTGFNFTAFFPSGHVKTSLGVCITWNSGTGASNLMDRFGFYGTVNGYVYMQMRTNGCLNIETDGSGTQHSPCIPITTGQVTWCTLLSDPANALAQLACFKPTFPFTQLPCTAGAGCAANGTVSVIQRNIANWGSLQKLQFGNNEIGTASGTDFWENLVVDYTNGAFPLGVGTLSTPWAGMLNPSRAIDWSQAGVVGGIPPRASNCATLSAGATTAQINSAIASCTPGQTVFLGAGTYSGLSTLTFVGHPNVTLRGAGADQTILQFTGSSGGCGTATASVCMQSTDNNNKGALSNGPVNWTAPVCGTVYCPGSTVLTLATVPNLKVGNIMILDQLDDTENSGCDTGGPLVTQLASATAICTPTAPGSGGAYSLEENIGGPERSISGTPPTQVREQMQVVTVAACNGSSTPGFACSGTNVAVTIAPGIYMPNWRSSQSPQAWWATNPCTGDGIENLTIDNTNSAAMAVAMNNCSNVWEKGVRSISPTRAHVQTQYTQHAEIRDGYWYAMAASSPSNYGWDQFGVYDSKAENMITHGIIGPYVQSGPGQGNVVAYNYSTNEYYPNSPGWNNPSNSQHSGGADLLLLEGNVFNTFDADIFHGTHQFTTLYRNRLTGFQPACASNSNPLSSAVYGSCTNNRVAIKNLAFGRFMNYIGNVLGTAGVHTQYFPAGGGDHLIFMLGNGASENNGICSPCVVPTDTNVPILAMRYGNWDNVTSAVRWCGNSTNTGWATTCASASEVPESLSAVSQTQFANAEPTIGDTTAGQGAIPPSFYLSSKPSWWGTTPWPPIGPDIVGGTSFGTTTVGGAWTAQAVGGFANDIPAQDCYKNVMGGSADGTSTLLSFNAATCYAGATGPIISISPSSFSFGGVPIGTASSPGTLTVSNSGNATFTLGTPYFTIGGTNASDFSVTGGTCSNGGTIAASASCTALVTFSPSIVGSESSNFSISGSSASPSSLTGSGLGPAITLSPSPVAFVNQALGIQSSPAVIVTLTNTGFSALTLSTPYFTITGANAADFSNSGTGTCSNGLVIPVNSSCTVLLTFTPSLTSLESAVLTATGSPSASATDNLGGTGVAVVNVRGTGTISGAGTVKP